MSESEFFSKKDFSFADNFIDIRLIYSSSRGHTEVYFGRKALKRFALKALKPEFREDIFYVGLLRKEFEIGFRLEHPFIIRTYSFEEVEGLGPCIVLEWVDGDTMDTHIENHSLDEKTWRKASTELCDALEYLEKHQIVHRDIKPSNVIITSDGCHVKLIDFGFADSPEYGTLKINGGSKDYCAPEQLSDSTITSSADIYALGKIMETLPLMKNRNYRKLVTRMTSAHIAMRPQSTGDIKAELNKALGGNRRNKFVIWMGLAVCAVGATFLLAIRMDEGTTPVQADKVEIEKKEEILDTVEREKPGVGSGDPKTVSPSTPVETVEPFTENVEPPAADNSKRMVHWMVILTAQQTQGMALKLRESGDPLWENHTKQEMEGWVDSQTDSSPEIREDCHEEITRIIERVKRGE